MGREKAYAKELEYEFVDKINGVMSSVRYTNSSKSCEHGYRYLLNVPENLKRSRYSIVDYDTVHDGIRSIHVSKDGKHYIYNGKLQHKIRGYMDVYLEAIPFDYLDVDVYRESIDGITEILELYENCYTPSNRIKGFYIPLKPYFKNPKLSSNGDYKLTVNGEVLPTTEKEFNLPVGSIVEVKLHKAKVFKGVVRLKSDGYTKELVRNDLDLSGTGLMVNAQTSLTIAFNRNSIVFNKKETIY